MSKTVISNSLDKQYFIEDIRGIKNTQILMEHIQGALDDILKDVKQLDEIEYFSISIDSSYETLNTDVNITYKVLETDEQYKTRLLNESERINRQIRALERDAKKLGYKLIKKNEEN